MAEDGFMNSPITERLPTVDFARKGKSVFFKVVVPVKSTVLQSMVPCPCIYGKHYLNLLNYQKGEREDSSGKLKVDPRGIRGKIGEYDKNKL